MATIRPGEIRAERARLPVSRPESATATILAGAEQPLALPGRGVDMHDRAGEIVQQARAADRLDPANRGQPGYPQQRTGAGGRCGADRHHAQVAMQLAAIAGPANDPQLAQAVSPRASARSSAGASLSAIVNGRRRRPAEAFGGGELRRVAAHKVGIVGQVFQNLDAGVLQRGAIVGRDRPAKLDDRVLAGRSGVEDGGVARLIVAVSIVVRCRRHCGSGGVRIAPWIVVVIARETASSARTHSRVVARIDMPLGLTLHPKALRKPCLGCHNPNTERWDRSNGRIYRMAWAETYKAVKVDLAARSDLELIDLLSHKNAWYARTAQRLLTERHIAAQNGGRALDNAATSRLTQKLNASSETERLHALWAAYGIGLWRGAPAIIRALNDSDQYVRAWAVQLALTPLSRRNPFLKHSPAWLGKIARLWFGSISIRSSTHSAQSTAWQILRALAAHGEDKADRNLPLLLWQSTALRMPARPAEAFSVAHQTAIPQIADYIYWYAGTFQVPQLSRVLQGLTESNPDTLRRRLAGLWLALEPRPNLPMRPSGPLSLRSSMGIPMLACQ